MDLVTHAMVGLLVGSIAANRKTPLYPVLLTGTLAAAMLDFDAILYPINLGLYFKYHRLFTHSLLLAPFYAGLGALPAWLWVRSRFFSFYLIALLSILLHLGLDLPCDYQLYLLFPLNRKDFAWHYIPYSSAPALLVITALALTILLVRFRKIGTAKLGE
jgi:inner membrane protein